MYFQEFSDDTDFNKLPEKNVKECYSNIVEFASNTTSNRGSTSGSKNKNVYDNPLIMSNIIGYTDKFSPTQKKILTTKGLNLLNVRNVHLLEPYWNYSKIL